jgi:hypothetical protein
MINPLNTKHRVLYLKTQFVPRSKHFYSCVFLGCRAFSSVVVLFPRLSSFFLGCKANSRVELAKKGHGPHSSKIVVLFYLLFVSYRAMYCLCLNVYCTTDTGLKPNCSEQIYHIIETNQLVA